MTGKIFINYRREDTQDAAARIHRELSLALGAKTLFMDVDNLMAGQRFDKELEKALAECDVFLAVIGPRWMSAQEERQKAGERDFVREEIAAALRRQIPVIPVLVNQAQLPREHALPEDIRDLIKHQKHDVRHEHFRRDVAPLIEAIKFLRGPSGKAMPWRAIGATAAGLGALTALLILISNFASAPTPSPELPTFASHPNSRAETAPNDDTRREVEATADAAEAKRKTEEEFERQRLAAILEEKERGRIAALPPQESAANTESPVLSGGWLGVKIQNVDDDTAAAIGLSVGTGALVSELISNGPAAGAGIEVQDAIIAVNNELIANSRDLARRIAEFAPGTTVDVKVWRGNREQIIQVTLGTSPGQTERTSTPEGQEQAETDAPVSLVPLPLTLPSPQGDVQADPDAPGSLEPAPSGTPPTPQN